MGEPRFSGMDRCLWDSAVELPLGNHIPLFVNTHRKGFTAVGLEEPEPKTPHEGLPPCHSGGWGIQKQGK